MVDFQTAPPPFKEQRNLLNSKVQSKLFCCCMSSSGLWRKVRYIFTKALILSTYLHTLCSSDFCSTCLWDTFVSFKSEFYYYNQSRLCKRRLGSTTKDGNDGDKNSFGKVNFKIVESSTLYAYSHLNDHLIL